MATTSFSLVRERTWRLTVEASRPRTSATVDCREGPWAEVIVADDGSGIPPERHEEALRRFGRLDAARHIGGAGLGLALVGAVARLHKGKIALEDNRPGLRVVLSIPVEDEAA